MEKKNASIFSLFLQYIKELKRQCYDEAVCPVCVRQSRRKRSLNHEWQKAIQKNMLCPQWSQNAEDAVL